MSLHYRGQPPIVRQAILARDGFACTWCGHHDDLEVDHIVPRSDGGTDDADNLRTLCTHCHDLRHGRIRLGRDYRLCPMCLHSDPLVQRRNLRRHLVRIHALPTSFVRRYLGVSV